MIRTERKDPSHATEADVDGREGWLCPKIMMENTVGCASRSSKLDPTNFKVSYDKCHIVANEGRQRNAYSGVFHNFIAILIF